MARQHRNVNPTGWAPPRGYTHGVIAEGRVLFIAGQVGWDPTAARPSFARGFAAQFEQALANMVRVLREAGGEPGNLSRVTLYVTHLSEYRKSMKAVGAAWRRHLGRHFPAMTLVEVKGLLEPKARVEIEATAVL